MTTRKTTAEALRALQDAVMDAVEPILLPIVERLDGHLRPVTDWADSLTRGQLFYLGMALGAAAATVGILSALLT